LRSIALHSGTQRAAPRSLRAPDFEYVGEIIVEGDRKEEPYPFGTEIPHGKAVKQAGAPDEDRMQKVFLQNDVEIDVGIGEFDIEDDVIVGEVRPQEEGLKCSGRNQWPRKLSCSS
jgi:hypothetical protein